MMKTFMTAILIFLTASCLASSGTTYCPLASDFKYNPSSGNMKAPGGWAILLGTNNVQVKTFVKVEASPFDGQIFDCVYNFVVEGQAAQLPVMADDDYYVADNLHDSVWRQGAENAICVNSNPHACRFHLQT